MKLDIQWWHSIQHNIVGLVPTINGKMLVIKSDDDGNFVGYKADEVTLQHLAIADDIFRLYAVCRKGAKVEEIRLLNPIIVDLLGIDPDEILSSTTFS